MLLEIKNYNLTLTEEEQMICNYLYEKLCQELPDAEHKLWHGHPVWFLNGNPIVGYSTDSKGIRLMFWSGADFDEKELNVRGKRFKDASIYYDHVDEINPTDIERWVEKSKAIQWDYKNIIKRKGVLLKLK